MTTSVRVPWSLSRDGAEADVFTLCGQLDGSVSTLNTPTHRRSIHVVVSQGMQASPSCTTSTRRPTSPSCSCPLPSTSRTCASRVADQHKHKQSRRDKKQIMRIQIRCRAVCRACKACLRNVFIRMRRVYIAHKRMEKGRKQNETDQQTVVCLNENANKRT